jgi:hypothetical protein
MRSRKHFAVIPFLVFLSVAPLMGQARNPDDAASQAWWFNVPSTPLIIEPEDAAGLESGDKGRFRYSLKNVSSKTIRGYRIGCIEQRRGKVRMLLDHRPFYPKRGLPPDYLAKNVHEFAVPSVEEVKSDSSCQGGRIAVTEVYFTDGSAWYAHKRPWETANKEP